jgi:hypothetical protein
LGLFIFGACIPELEKIGRVEIEKKISRGEEREFKKRKSKPSLIGIKKTRTISLATKKSRKRVRAEIPNKSPKSPEKLRKKSEKNRKKSQKPRKNSEKLQKE